VESEEEAPNSYLLIAQIAASFSFFSGKTVNKITLLQNWKL
jgi:hypothetical protein